MGKQIAWIGTTVLALAGIVIGVLPIDAGPRWVWLTVGIVLGFFVAFTYPSAWGSKDSDEPTNQRVRTGKNSRVIQAGRDVDLRGGMGDKE